MKTEADPSTSNNLEITERHRKICDVALFYQIE
jgi:hypothetical protein